LVLDDDLDIKALIKMALQKQGYRVFGFTDPFLALEHFKNTHSAYSLVISDLRMPGINGFEFIQRIRTINSKVKILLMTAFEINESDFARVLPKLKINGFVQKPISMKSLVKTVKMCAIEN
jgi:DNA-binding response OmpR family regulator